MKEKFYEFLRKRRCFAKWKKYFVLVRTAENENKDIDTYLDDCNPREYLECSFTWSNANDSGEYNKNDHLYWSDINDKWHEYVKLIEKT